MWGVVDQHVRRDDRLVAAEHDLTEVEKGKVPLEPMILGREGARVIECGRGDPDVVPGLHQRAHAGLRAGHRRQRPEEMAFVEYRRHVAAVVGLGQFLRPVPAERVGAEAVAAPREQILHGRLGVGEHLVHVDRDPHRHPVRRRNGSRRRRRGGSGPSSRGGRRRPQTAQSGAQASARDRPART